MTKRDRIEKKAIKRRMRRAFSMAKRVRGRVMNLPWLGWFGEWQEAYEALCRFGDVDRMTFAGRSK